MWYRVIKEYYNFNHLPQLSAMYVVYVHILTTIYKNLCK